MRRLARGATIEPARPILARGRIAFAARLYAGAGPSDMAYALAPDLPGFLRQLGSTYHARGAAAPTRELVRCCLVQRRFGASVEEVQVRPGQRITVRC